MNDELKPCPWCACKVDFIATPLYKSSGEFEVEGEHLCDCPLRKNNLFLYVDHVPGSMFEAIKAWNTRKESNDGD